MAGLINTSMEENTLDPSKTVTPGSTGFDAVTRQVDPNKETVSGQLDTLIAKDSPYIQRARTNAAEVANSRGLLNSSMAAGAGEAAAIDAALPIAASDASTYSGAARENNAATNASLSQTAQASNQSKLAGGAAQNEQALQTLRGTQAKQLADIEANYKELLQASDSAARILTTTQQAIAAIQADPNTSAEQKQAAVDKMTAMLHSSLELEGKISNIDLSGLLDFSALSPAPAAPAAAPAPAAAAAPVVGNPGLPWWMQGQDDGSLQNIG
jgi:hypothetical protein